MSSNKKALVSIIAAIGRNRALGKDNELLWHIPDDLRRFKELTLGHPVIMGRKTFDSIVASLGKVLPGRTNIVVTRDADRSYEGAIIAHSIDEAISRASALDDTDVFVIGGGEIYAQALPLADRLFLTFIDDEKKADSFFPPYESDFPHVDSDEAREWNGIRYRWITLRRAQPHTSDN